MLQLSCLPGWSNLSAQAIYEIGNELQKYAPEFMSCKQILKLWIAFDLLDILKHRRKLFRSSRLVSIEAYKEALRGNAQVLK